MATRTFRRGETPPPEDPYLQQQAEEEKKKAAEEQKRAGLYQAASQAAGNVGQPPGGAGSTSNPWLFIGGNRGRQRLDNVVLPDVGMPYDVGSLSGDWLTAEEMKNLYWNFKPEEAASLDNYIAKKGMDVSRMSSMDKWKVWLDIVESSAQYQQAGKNFGPWGVMFMEIWNGEKAKAGEASKARTITQTSTSVDLSTREGAKSILWQASQTLLGRAPTEDETDRFYSSVTTLERANPVVTRTTRTTDDEGIVVSEESERSGGVDQGARSMIAQEEAMANPEYGAYQAATTYYDALMQAIKG